MFVSGVEQWRRMRIAVSSANLASMILVFAGKDNVEMELLWRSFGREVRRGE